MSKYYLFSSKNERKDIFGPDGVFLKSGSVPYDQLVLIRLFNEKLEGFLLTSNSFLTHFAQTPELLNFLKSQGVREVEVELEDQSDFEMQRSAVKNPFSQLNFKNGGYLKIRLGESLCLHLEFMDEQSGLDFKSNFYCGQFKVGHRVYQYGDEKTDYFFHELFNEPLEKKIESDAKEGELPVWIDSMQNREMSEEAIYSNVWKFILIAIMLISAVLLIIL